MSDIEAAPTPTPRRRKAAAAAAAEPSLSIESGTPVEEASASVESSAPMEPAAPMMAAAAGGQVMGQWLSGMTELSQEIARFTQQRLQEDAEAWMQLASCRSVEEAFACQQRFAETAMKQYFDEATRLSQLFAGLASWPGAAPPFTRAAA
ncbi:MAG TPA: phasin family protein [Stellaceae bacterium]|nr:phasin family protein [Stellaceae bacterium]